MTPEKAQLVAVFAPALKLHGFKKRGASWYRINDLAVQVVNVQQSQFARWFFINLGVGVFSLGCKPFPPEYECHIRSRLDHFHDPSRLQALLDFHKREFYPPDAEVVLAILLKQGVPWLEKCSTEAGFAEEARKGRFQLHHSVKDEYARAQQAVQADGPASGGSAA